MATDKYIHCTASCSDRQWIFNLFEVLNDLSQEKPVVCHKCDSPAVIRLTFPFLLGAGHLECKVIDCFRPDVPSTWKDPKGREVQFYPFLVILETDDRSRHIWCPYWHIIDRSPKYGQFTTIFEYETYRLLLQKARDKGYLL